MEFLDGEELRQLIAQQRPMPLEDKIGLMAQVCDGLAYAHREGVVHRDIKPANILVLRNGGVKILDFGIARIMGSEPGLTRTGFIVGTLRYMAPEQGGGQADHRADVFSVGAVFYEFLALRPAFPGNGPMEILEALRTFEPPRLNELDPTIPADLADTIAMAMRKDPVARLGDLAMMRERLLATQQQLAADARQMRETLRERVEQVRRLHVLVADHLGQPLELETPPASSDAARMADLQADARVIAQQIELLQAALERAVNLEPTVKRGLERLHAGRFDDAIADLQSVVSAFPEHSRASTGLKQARAGKELAALPGSDDQTLVQAPAPTPAFAARSEPAVEPPARVEWVSPLRRRGAARWKPATLAAAVGALGVVAVGAYLIWSVPTRQVAVAPPSPASSPARSIDPLAAERQATDELRRRVASARKESAETQAEVRAAAVFGAAVERERHAEAAVAAQRYGEARTHYTAALTDYEAATAQARRAAAASAEAEAARRRRVEDERRAAEDARASLAARAAAERQRRLAEVEPLRQQSSTSGREAEQAGGDRYAAVQMTAARSKVRDALAALDRQDYSRAAGLFREADSDFKGAAHEAQRQAAAERQATAARERQAAEIEKLRRDVIALRDQAIKSEAGTLARDMFEAAQAKEREGEGLFSARDYSAARQPYQEAVGHYDGALKRALALGEARVRANQERARMEADKQRAQRTSPYFGDAQRQEQEGAALYQALGFKDAGERFRAAAALYARAIPPSPSMPPPPRESLGRFGADPSPELQKVIADLRRAYESKDVALLQRIRPGLGSEELRRIRETFDSLRSYQLDLHIETIEVRGSEAQARAFRKDVTVAKDGQIHRSESRVTVRFKLNQNRWTIDDIK
jgi:hypothetical protein